MRTPTDRRIIGPLHPRDRLRLRADPGPARHGDGHGPRLHRAWRCCSSPACGSGPVMKVMAALVGLALIVAVASPYRRARLLSFMDPSAHSSGSGYQVMQSLIGLGSGHLYGAGLGGGQAQWGFLPNAHTDFIFSVIGEELGIVGRRPRAGAPRGLPLARHPGGDAVGGPLRRPARARARGLGGGGDPHQRRGGGRRAAGHRDPAALHLVRWLVARDHDGGGRRAHQRRPAGRGRQRPARRPWRATAATASARGR